MKKIAWITDSTAYITESLKNNKDVFVLPLSIIFGEKAYEDGVDLTTEELYEKINNEKEIPKTSQPSVGKTAEVFNSLKENYDAAIAVHISGKLSGTLEATRSAAEIADFSVEVIDSKSMSYAITSLLLSGIEQAKTETDYKKIAEDLRAEAEKHENLILLGSLEQFYKGGRMSGTQFLLGNLLKIKPIIRINPSGEFMLSEKVRSEKKATKRILELFDDSYTKFNVYEIQILHGNVPARAEEIKEELLSKYPELKIVTGEISSTIAVHAGEGTVGLMWQNNPGNE
ncbi:DegV family protein [Rossellomorea vietnamensis]|uniref:DegV family protein n=1 Tax=Rossellomorea vietnamensis TaxID=218284 RepID=A0A5D4MG93_9BACI|nr:DegV family protein [Rossellomorea vietnamensis]TYS00364.1 DegV family protein [Rossellomorea vietnamensis]